MPAHGQVQFGDALAEHALAAAAVDQLGHLVAGMLLDQLHQLFVLLQGLFAELQNLQRTLLVGAGQHGFAVTLPGFAGLAQRGAYRRGRCVFLQQLAVGFEVGDALVELDDGDLRPRFGTQHQVTLGDTLAQHALHAGAVHRFRIAYRRLARLAAGEQTERQ